MTQESGHGLAGPFVSGSLTNQGYWPGLGSQLTFDWGRCLFRVHGQDSVPCELLDEELQILAVCQRPSLGFCHMGIHMAACLTKANEGDSQQSLPARWKLQSYANQGYDSTSPLLIAAGAKQVTVSNYTQERITQRCECPEARITGRLSVCPSGKL